MKILVPGATGSVGRHVVEQALARGHEVIAIARNPEKLALEHPNLTKRQVDILNAQAVESHLTGVDAVLSTVGMGASKTPTTLYSEGTRNLLEGMSTYGVQRIVVISSEVAEHWAHQRPLKLWVVLPLLQKFLGATYDDMRRMDIVLWESRARWTAIRAPRIRTAPGKGKYRLAGQPLPRGWMITAVDMATAMLDIIERDDLDRQHVYIAN
ncbi:NAD(P)-dependent oxidoreductase [Glutamicibacter mishrai]|uniref:NAD-dependent epimerase/dehydratase family protein n=1 Tax=Glutamicibacter mishrai TaxID=1775880 RepID=A0A6H0SNA2_9MICC|nr:NAD(P)H-binding protein [Glutamicibacter mishrai]QIV87815.1 NAD-dependent epimerase/dehydratase family protein [Glutamicibacter mishrai]